MKLHLILLLAALACTHPAGAQKGRIARPAPVRPTPDHIINVDKDSKDSQARTSRDIHGADLYGDRSTELRNSYTRALEKTLTPEEYLKYSDLADDLYNARFSDQIKPLPGQLDWLSIRIPPDERTARYIAEVSRVMAGKIFSQPYDRANISVIASGLSMFGMKEVNAAAIEDNANPTRQMAKSSLVSTLIEENLSLKPTGSERIDLALRPFRDRLLIIVAHHGQRNAITGSEPTILIQEGDRKRDVPARLLRQAAVRNRVNLFILGCNSSSSQPIGTRGPLREQDAVAGIQRLFLSNISTYGDVFKHLAGDRVQLVFDTVLAEEGVFALVDKDVTQVPAFKSPRTTWDSWIVHGPNLSSTYSSSENSNCSATLNSSSPVCGPASQLLSRPSNLQAPQQVWDFDLADEPETGSLSPDRHWSLDGYSEDVLDSIVDSAGKSGVALIVIGVMLWFWSSTLFEMPSGSSQDESRLQTSNPAENPGCTLLLVDLSYAGACFYLAYPAISAIAEGIRKASFGYLSVGISLLIALFLSAKPFLYLRRLLTAGMTS